MTNKRGFAVVAALVVAIIVVVVWLRVRQDPASFLIFDHGNDCAIIVPPAATPEELTAARLLSATLAHAAGTGDGSFPIQTESVWRFWQWGIYVGETTRASKLPLPGANRLERPVGFAAFPFGVVLRSRWPEDIAAAAGWFLEKQLQAHWFMPGPLGESVPRKETLRLAVGVELVTPSFASRNLGGLDSVVEREWFAANRLRAVIAHGHSMSDIFQPADIARYPELAPLVSWQKYFPTRPNEQEWQPNIAAPSAGPLASAVLRRELTDKPGEIAVRLAMNDSIRYDQSPATLARVGPPKYFRSKPDYSNLVFGFANQVAKELQTDFPDRLISAYAYDWTEDTPKFPVEPNIVPYLTADRSQWFDAAFAAQDQDLMRRWVAAGPKIVGIYDYYEGAPFLVPRPTLYAVSRSIPFAYGAGVRAFYAEAFSNWGLDGPKCWLAAQLLWDAKQDPAALLDTYYREYWQEAAGPMREFFGLCDRQWLEQPLPSYWLKYFKDEQQALRFPRDVRLALNQKLEAARSLVRSEVVRQRLAMTAAAFAVADAFCRFNEARDRLSRLTLAPTIDRPELMTAVRATRDAMVNLKMQSVRTEAGFPLAMASKVIDEYTRNDPRRHALWRLRGTQVEDAASAFDDLVPAVPPAADRGVELIVDGQLQKLAVRDAQDFTALDWVKSGYWRGHGEPYETRQISMIQSGGSGAIRFQGCKQETLSQWHKAEPAADYVGIARVRAQVSPGNMTFLIITFLDEKGKYLGIGSIDRLPVGDWSQGVELAVLIQAPPEAKQIGLGVRVLNQVNDDYAEFSQLSLRRLN